MRWESTFLIALKQFVSCPNLHALAMTPIAELLTTLQNLSNDELLPVARAFSQFLNLANTAEQYHSISPKGEAASNPEVIARTLRKLKNQPDLSEATIKKLSNHCRWNWSSPHTRLKSPVVH